MTVDELKHKSTDELKVMLKKYKEEEVIEDLNQYIRKILINSVK